jgi:hypothetical protein
VTANQKLLGDYSGARGNQNSEELLPQAKSGDVDVAVDDPMDSFWIYIIGNCSRKKLTDVRRISSG